MWPPAHVCRGCPGSRRTLNGRSPAPSAPFGERWRSGVVGSSVARPALRRDREALLRGFLGEVEIAEEAAQCGEDASPLVAEGLLEDHYRSTIGRTSIAPPMCAAGIREASSIAASRP